MSGDDFSDNCETVVHNQGWLECCSLTHDLLGGVSGKTHIAAGHGDGECIGLSERAPAKQIDKQAAGVLDLRAISRHGEHVDAESGSSEPRNDGQKTLEVAVLHHVENDR
jgi:hypothetical protein